MKRLATITLFMLTLTGCSEFRIITKAAMRELQAEAISVDMPTRDLSEQVKVELTRHDKKRTVVAQAGPTFSTYRRTATVAANPYPNGLWGPHSP